MGERQKTVVVGAGPVGSLAALYAANRGDMVEIYELRSDLRDASTTPLNFTKSINLALSERGLNALRQAHQPKLLDHVTATTIPMRGRMIHGRRPNGALYEESQDYDVNRSSILAIDRGRLNERLLDILEAMPNVKFFFNHKLTGANFKTRKAWFEAGATGRGRGRDGEIEVDFDFMMGADGAHSSVRYHLMKYTRMSYQQEYIDTLWCEFRIEPSELVSHDDDPKARFRISPNHLHIWPGRDFMFIAIPSEDGSFTCTLFAPSATYEQLESNIETLPSFFDHHFPGVTELVPTSELVDSFRRNPHLPLISIKCEPYHYSSSVVILGDAAHAMVPFYGQGMNSGLEDVRVLFSILDKHNHDDAAAAAAAAVGPGPEPDASSRRAAALAEYTATRAPDAHAINDLALQNYTEMRASVLSPAYRLRKALEETLSVWAPGLGWRTQYSRVSFGNERYSVVVAKTERQGRLLVRGFVAVVATPLIAGVVAACFKYRRALAAGVRGVSLFGTLARRAQAVPV